MMNYGRSRPACSTTRSEIARHRKQCSTNGSAPAIRPKSWSLKRTKENEDPHYAIRCNLFLAVGCDKADSDDSSGTHNGDRRVGALSTRPSPSAVDAECVCESASCGGKRLFADPAEQLEERYWRRDVLQILDRAEKHREAHEQAVERELRDLNKILADINKTLERRPLR